MMGQNRDYRWHLENSDINFTFGDEQIALLG
jgi:hypothetical protein